MGERMLMGELGKPGELSAEDQRTTAEPPVTGDSAVA